MAYCDDEEDIFMDEAQRFQSSDSFKTAQTDLEEKTEAEFQQHYQLTKHQYRTILTAMLELKKASIVISEMGALDIDQELGENTDLLVEDYARLLEQAHMASYWEQEG